MDIDDLFQDSSSSTTASTESTQPFQVLSRLDTENGSVHVLVCREGAGLKLTVCAGTQAWAGVLTAAKLSSMASVVGMSPEEFTQETERALTGRPLNTENFVYSVCYEAEKLHLVWKRHLLADNVKFQLGSILLEQEQASSTFNTILDHAVKSTLYLQDRIIELERENLRLVQERKVALEKLEQCACLKEQVEAEMYSKFKLVLNGKKSKIRHLMEELESCQTQCGTSTTEDTKGSEPSTRQDNSPQHCTPSPPPGLLGEPQEVVSPPVKRRKREARINKGTKEPLLPKPPSISHPPIIKDRVRGGTSTSTSTVDSDDLLQLL